MGGGTGWLPDGEGVVDDLRAKLDVLPLGFGGAALLASGYLICSRKTLVVRVEEDNVARTHWYREHGLFHDHLLS